MIIAIDGPAGAGKSSVAKDLANRLNMLYIDTGAMYRALTWKALNNNIDLSNNNRMELLLKDSKIDLIPIKGQNFLNVLIDNKNITSEIREPLISKNVSQVASHKGVRDIMVVKQRNLAENKTGVVMDGRDIGTVVFPNADIKIFLTASVEERANRRFKEQMEKGITTDIQELINDISNRDHYDMNRAVAPLKPANDSIIIDTTSMNYEEVLEKLIDISKKIINPV
ncbi:MAG: (d)CMP kinase [Candidatus Sericytochromatia bacterium]